MNKTSTVWIVENYDTNEYLVFSDLNEANAYVRHYYREHMLSFYGSFNNDTIKHIREDLENLEWPQAYITDIMYTREGKLILN